MPDLVEPIELCLESLDPAKDEQPYVRCVALEGGEPGLGLTAEGEIIWHQNDAAALLLWVSADNQLVAFRRNEANRVRLTRAERSLELPTNKPVVTLNEDVLEIEDRAFRVHVHGVAPTVAPPVRLTFRRAQTWVASALAAVSVAACHTDGAATASGGASRITDSTQVTEPVLEPRSPLPDASTGGQAAVIAAPEGQGGAGGLGTTIAFRSTKKRTPPIEVRHNPPGPPAPNMKPGGGL